MSQARFLPAAAAELHELTTQLTVLLVLVVDLWEM